MSLVVRKLLARATVAMLAGSLLLLHSVGVRFRSQKHKSSSQPRQVVMIGTFYNDGWFKAHAGPLSLASEIDEILVVCDRPVAVVLPGVKFECPSRRLQSLVGRNLARLFVLLRTTLQLRPAIFMGYHLMPNALLALLCARLCGAMAIYQMTGGPVQVVGGGYRSENPLLKATMTPSKWLERVLFRLIRCFDAVVVRGEKAKAFVLRHELSEHCFIVTGAVDTDSFNPSEQAKKYDLVYVGRLVPVKGFEYLFEVVVRLNSELNASIALVGDGPLMGELQARARELGVADKCHFLGRLTDVLSVLNQSRVFILFSENEGMSIAMIEAMAAGLPVVVRNVGDLSDAFAKSDPGTLVDHPEEAVASLNELLSNRELLKHRSEEARRTAVAYYSTEAMALHWDRQIRQLLDVDGYTVSPSDSI